MFYSNFLFSLTFCPFLSFILLHVFLLFLELNLAILIGRIMDFKTMFPVWNLALINEPNEVAYAAKCFKTGEPDNLIQENV